MHRQDDGFLFPCDVQKAPDGRIHLLWTGYGGPLGPEQILMHTVVEGDEVRHGLVDRNVIGREALPPGREGRMALSLRG